MTAQLSRERLEEKLLEHIKHGGNSEEETMIRMLLAGMDSKAVAKVETVGVCWYADNGVPRKPAVGAELYAAPPAQVAVTKKSNTDYLDTLALDTAREIMCDVNRRADFLGGDIQLLSRIQCRIDEAFRAAMPKAEPADQTAAKEKLLDLLQRGINFQSAEIPVNATSAPMQPLEFDDRGTLRFKENKIVRRLLDYSKQRGYGLNEIALEDFTDDDRMQLAQLIGYSLSGYGELSYVSDESWERAASAAPEQEE
ncbi:hypothetical protein [Kosakonia sp. 1610]|uniref:hypothetical protein n=1 Tax=Kosakonia sp. 1610 TaxID=3156426 RepID=UPI003D1FB45E